MLLVEINKTTFLTAVSRFADDVADTLEKTGKKDISLREELAREIKQCETYRRMAYASRSETVLVDPKLFLTLEDWFL